MLGRIPLLTACSGDMQIRLDPWRLLPSLLPLHWTCLVTKQLDCRAARRGPECCMSVSWAVTKDCKLGAQNYRNRCLIILDARFPRSRGQQGRTPTEAQVKMLSRLSQLLGAAGHPRLAAASLPSPPLPSHGRAPLSVSASTFPSCYKNSDCFWLCHAAFRILAPQPRIKLTSPAVEAQSLNPWTARDVPRRVFWTQGPP